MRFAAVDHDGLGPGPEYLYCAHYIGQYVWAYFLSRWDYTTWTMFSITPQWEGTFNSVLAMPSESGPAGAQDLIIAGTFVSSTGGARNIARYDGSTVYPVGPSAAADFAPSGLYVRSTASWDPDGDGPQPARLVVGGGFTRWGGAEANNVAMWDGQTWAPLGPGLPSSPGRMMSFDFDGAGPAQPRLVVSLNNGSGIQVWDGTQWTALGDVHAYSMATHDFDSDGPLPPRVVIISDSVPSSRFLAWMDDYWMPFGANWPSEHNAGIGALVSVRRPSDLAHVLAAVGHYPIGDNYTGPVLAALYGDTWSFPPGTPNGVPPSTPAGYGVGNHSGILYDPDGPGPRSKELVVGGMVTGSKMCWTGDGFVPLGHEVAGWTGGGYTPILSFVTHDPDGSGPLKPRVFASGSFWAAGGRVANFLAEWDGLKWCGVGAAPPSTLRSIRALSLWDADGTGPGVASIVGIRYSTDASEGRIVQFDGDGWAALGSTAGQDVRCVREFDTDGLGPLPPTLFAVGSMTPSSALMFDGQSWVPAGTPRSDMLRYLLVHDFDRDGPQVEQLVAIGWTGVYRWAGSDWETLGGNVIMSLPLSGNVPPTAVSWDSDGDGPAPNELVVGVGHITTPQGVFRAAAAFNGVSWRGLAATSPGPIYKIDTFDLDGPGPATPEIVVGYQYQLPNGTNAFNAARLVSGQWVAVGAGALAFADYEPGVIGPRPGEIFIAGNFTEAGGLPAAGFARKRLGACHCEPDVNCDFVLDARDVQVQELAVGGNMSLYCRDDPDFNRDFALDGFDVEAIEVAVGGGPCP